MSNPYRYVMKIEYDEKAKSLIETLRKVGKKEGFRVRVRGSGERAKFSLQDSDGATARMYDQSLPLKYASHVRIYLNAPTGDSFIGSGWVGYDWNGKTQVNSK